MRDNSTAARTWDPLQMVTQGLGAYKQRPQLILHLGLALCCLAGCHLAVLQYYSRWLMHMLTQLLHAAGRALIRNLRVLGYACGE